MRPPSAAGGAAYASDGGPMMKKRTLSKPPRHGITTPGAPAATSLRRSTAGLPQIPTWPAVQPYWQKSAAWVARSSYLLQQQSAPGSNRFPETGPSDATRYPDL